MKCGFRKRRNIYSTEVKVGDHIIPQSTQFIYGIPIVQNDGEVEYVSNRLQGGCLKWIRSHVLYKIQRYLSR